MVDRRKKSKDQFWKHLSTDYDNQTFDTGRVLVLVVILSMIVLQGWDVIAHATKFDPQSYGAGVAAVLAGLGAYIFGDNTKRPDPVVNPPQPDVNVNVNSKKPDEQPDEPEATK